MMKYQLRLSTRKKDGRWDHRYTGLYATVAEIFAKPEFVAYVQENMIGENNTIKVFAVNVADQNVQQGVLGYASQRVDKRQLFLYY